MVKGGELKERNKRGTSILRFVVIAHTLFFYMVYSRVIILILKRWLSVCIYLPNGPGNRIVRKRRHEDVDLQHSM